MSTISERGPAGPAGLIFRRMASRLAGVLEAIARERSRRRALANLRDMPDWILRDIGITRGEINDLAQQMRERTRQGGEL